MNHTRISHDIPDLYRITGSETEEIDLLFGLLSWARNDAFARWAEACAYWGALVDSHTYLQELSARLTRHNIEHTSFNLASNIDTELMEAKQIMANLPGGRAVLTLHSDAEYALAAKRLIFLREYNTPK